MISTTDIRRFWNKVDKSSNYWMWTASIKPNGYGQLYWNGKTQLAHRVAWLLRFGPIPLGFYVLHSCDIKRCVRYLFLGSPSDNSRDMIEKTRGKGQFKALSFCKNGHSLYKTARRDWRGDRFCHTCKMAWQRRQRTNRRLRYE